MPSQMLFFIAQQEATRSLIDGHTILLVLLTTVVLGGLLFVGQVLKRQPETNFDPAIIRNFNKRVVAGLTICVVLVVALMLSKMLTVILFGLVSFWALREFITMTPTRRGDHRTLFWVFFLFTPLQYVLVARIPDNYLQGMNEFTPVSYTHLTLPTKA